MHPTDANTEIIAAFAAATALYANAKTWDTLEAETAFNNAFEVAARHGWDPVKDTTWQDAIFKATHSEILAEALVRALQTNKPSYIELRFRYGDWTLLQETLCMDAISKTFSKELRQEITDALQRVERIYESPS